MIAWIKKLFKNSENKNQEITTPDNILPESKITSELASESTRTSLDKNHNFCIDNKESLISSIDISNYKDGDLILDNKNKPILGKIAENVWQVLDKRDGRIKIIERVWVANLPVYIPKDIPTGKTARDLYS